MSNENKLKLEDITFDDFIGDGINVGDTEIQDSDLGDAQEVFTKELELDNIQEEVKEQVKEEVKEEVKENIVSEPKDDSVVGEILSQFGYEFEEDFSDTSEGLVNLTKAVGNKMAEDQLDGLFNAYPEIQQHLDYVLSGGTSKDWLRMSNQVMDFENITVDENDMRTQRAVLGEYFKLKGHEPEFINELLDDYTDSNKLYDKAVRAKGALTEYYGRQRDKSSEIERQKRVEEQQKQRSFWDSINDTIQNSKDFAGLTVQEKDKNNFFTYLTKTDKDGKTEREKAHTTSSTEIKLAIDYLMFKGFNLKDIIATKAKTASASSLREKIKSNSSVKSAARPKRTSGFDFDDLDLNLGSL